MKNRIKELRKEQGLSQEKFGELVGVTRSHIASMENGKALASKRVIKLISEKCKVNEEWIEFGTGEKYIPEPLINEFAVLIGQFVTETMEDEEKEFRKKVIESLIKLDDAGWGYIEKLVDDIKKD